MRIAFLTYTNLYDTKRYFGNHLAKALKKKGVEVQILDGNAKEFDDELFKIACNPHLIDFTCSFNSQTPTDEGQFLSDLICVPHIFFNLDPLYYYRNAFKSPYMIISCADHFDCEYARARGFEKVFFLGHAVDQELSFEPKQERPYDVVFIGSCYDHETLRKYWRENLPKETVKIIENAIDIVLGDNKTPLFSAVELAMNERAIDHAHDDKVASIAIYVDNYVRGKDRTELIRSIKKAHVHVFGDIAVWRHEKPILDWSHSLAGMKNMTLHPGVSYEESLTITKQSKISLNSMPFFKNGTHERIFSSLACGSLPITTDNLWIREHFEHGKDILIYKPNQWGEVDDMVNSYLADPKKREELVMKGREKVMHNHTWDVRAQQLLENWEWLRKQR